MPSVHVGDFFRGLVLKQPKARHPSTASTGMASGPEHHRHKEPQGTTRNKQQWYSIYGGTKQQWSTSGLVCANHNGVLCRCAVMVCCTVTVCCGHNDIRSAMLAPTTAYLVE